MEIIILLTVILVGSSPYWLVILMDDQIMKRAVKVAKANLNRRKQHVPGIVTSDMLAITPRNKDWGPDGKLTQMWEDAFAYWQLKDPAGTLGSYRIKQHEWEQECAELKASADRDFDLYKTLMQTSRGNYGTIESAVDCKMRYGATRSRLEVLAYAGPQFTKDEKVVAGLAKRYGNEVFYNNDLVYMSAQKQMPTFDYIALTSV